MRGNPSRPAKIAADPCPSPPIPRLALQDEVIARVRDGINRRKLRPNERLGERKLRERFTDSRARCVRP